MQFNKSTIPFGMYHVDKNYLEFLKNKGERCVPILLLDDIFDKLDISRVQQIVKLVSDDNFGQIFITDTDRDRLAHILPQMGSDYKMFMVDRGQISELEDRK